MARAYGPEVGDKLPHALAGAAVWLVTALATATGAIDLTLVDLLLLLAPLVVVPIGLVAAARKETPLAQWLRLAAAVLLVPALLADRGGVAGVLAVAWLAGAVVMAVETVLARLPAPSFSPPVLARLASPVYLTVGAAFLIMSRLGLRPVGIGAPIVELPRRPGRLGRPRRRSDVGSYQ